MESLFSRTQSKSSKIVPSLPQDQSILPLKKENDLINQPELLNCSCNKSHAFEVRPHKEENVLNSGWKEAGRVKFKKQPSKPGTLEWGSLRQLGEWCQPRHAPTKGKGGITYFKYWYDTMPPFTGSKNKQTKIHSCELHNKSLFVRSFNSADNRVANLEGVSVSDEKEWRHDNRLNNQCEWAINLEKKSQKRGKKFKLLQNWRLCWFETEFPFE